MGGGSPGGGNGQGRVFSEFRLHFLEDIVNFCRLLEKGNAIAWPFLSTTFRQEASL
jgi:hypothetical protein